MQADNEMDYQRVSIKVSAGLALWTFGWAATLALARFGPDRLWADQPVASWVAVGVNVAVGIGWIVAIMRFLQGIDELQRKIMLDALAVTLGVGWVSGFGYVVADTAGLVPFDVSAGVLPALMGIVFLIAFAVGMVRYR